MQDKGFVKTPLAMRDWRKKVSIEARDVYNYLSLYAYHKPSLVDGVQVNTGGVKTSRGIIARECQIDRDSVRNILISLEKIGAIRVETATRYTLIYITYLEEQPEELKLEQPKPKPKKEPTARKPKFVPPTFEEIREYAQSANINCDLEDFKDHFDSNGWKVGGKTQMKDWKAALRKWNRRSFTNSNTGGRTFKQIDRDEQDRKNYEATERLRESIHKGIARAIATNGADDEFPF